MCISAFLLLLLALLVQAEQQVFKGGPETIQLSALQRPQRFFVYDLRPRYIKFSVPANRRPDDPLEFADEASYIFELSILTKHIECGFTHVILNDKILKGHWNGSFIGGRDTLAVDTADNQHHEQLEFSWRAMCVKSETCEDRIQILTVAVGSDLLDIEDRTPVPGFTLYFNHYSGAFWRLVPNPDPEEYETEDNLAWAKTWPQGGLPRAVTTIAYRAKPLKWVSKERAKELDMASDKVRIRKMHPAMSQCPEPDFAENLAAELVQLFQRRKHEIDQCDTFNCVVNVVFYNISTAFWSGRLDRGYDPWPDEHDRNCPTINHPGCDAWVTSLQFIQGYGASKSRFSVITELPAFWYFDEHPWRRFPKRPTIIPVSSDSSDSSLKGRVRLALKIITCILGVLFMGRILYQYHLLHRPCSECDARQAYLELAQIDQFRNETNEPSSEEEEESMHQPPGESPYQRVWWHNIADWRRRLHYHEEDDATLGSRFTDGFVSQNQPGRTFASLARSWTPYSRLFTPYGTGTTPESSVVAISPRPSVETLRTDNDVFA